MKSKWVVVSQSCASAVEFLGTNQDASRDVHSGICVLSLFIGESGKLWTIEEGVQLAHTAQAPADFTAKGHLPTAQMPP